MTIGWLSWLLTAALCLRTVFVAAYTKSDCYFPFVYNGTQYSYCTRNAYHLLWCSLDRVYKGRWAVCGPEVPKDVLDSIRTAVDEVGKEKAKLAQEQSSIDSVAKFVAQLSAANQMAHSNKSAAINALDQRLAALNRTLLQMELEQRNLDQRAANQESLRPLEIGSMILLTVAVIVMGVLLYVFHCCAGRKGDGSGGSQSPSLPETPQLNCLTLRRVQPPTDPLAESDAAAATRQAESAKKFPGHFYHLTVDEEDEEAGDEEAEEYDDEGDAGDDASSEQHSRAAAALASAAANSQSSGETGGGRQTRFLNR